MTPHFFYISDITNSSSFNGKICVNVLKSAVGSCCVAFPQLVNAEKSGNNYMYSQEVRRFNRKWLEKCSIGEPQPLQSKPAVVEMVDPNRTRP